MNKENIWFVADCHFGHKNLLRFVPYRAQKLGLNLDNENVVDEHDNALIELWNSIINKKDIVYILGDFSFHGVEKTKIILEKLNGKKHLIIGNHDGACKSLTNYFVSTSQIKEVVFKKTVYDFLDENFCCVLSHFPMVAWNRRMHGSAMIHGHTHGSICEKNLNEEELRVDIGLDSKLAKCEPISLKDLYYHLKNNVAKGKTFKEHIDYVSSKIGQRY